MDTNHINNLDVGTIMDKINKFSFEFHGRMDDRVSIMHHEDGVRKSQTLQDMILCPQK